MQQRNRGLAAAGFAMLVVASPALAQTPTGGPTQPAPVTAQPPARLPPGALPLPVSPFRPESMIGRWIHTRTDAETRTSDSVTIEFLADGRYLAKNRHSLFPTPEKPSQGRYAVANIQRNAFDLRIERSLADPESDSQDAVEIQRITVVDPDTLQAADGSVVRRVKE